MSVRDVKIERGTWMALGALQKVQFGFCFSQGGSSARSWPDESSLLAVETAGAAC